MYVLRKENSIKHTFKTIFFTPKISQIDLIPWLAESNSLDDSDLINLVIDSPSDLVKAIKTYYISLD